MIMTTNPRAYDGRDVAAACMAHGVASVLERLGVRCKASNDATVRTQSCPSCGPRSRRDAVRFSVATGLWRCSVCQKGGDILAAIGGFSGFDVKTEYPDVVRVAAELVSYAAPADPRDMERRRRELADRAAQAEAERQAERARQADEARRASARVWQRLSRTSATGEAYASERGLDARKLREDSRVRYDGAGGLCVPLWDPDGDLVNVVTRHRAPGDGPKVTGLRRCPTLGTLVDRVQDIARGAAVILTEGAADALTAATKWRRAVILGAHGAGRMADIATMAAPRVLAAGDGARLVIVGDGDPTGRANADKARDAAIAAGLVLGDTIKTLDLGAHKDLNAAHVAGWDVTR
jgi:ribosomal protein L37AE/L43A